MRLSISIVVPLVLGYAVTMRWIWDHWMLPESYYTHGPLLVPLAVFLVWHRRARWGAFEARFDSRGWWLLGPGLFLHVCGAALTVDSLSAASLCLSVPGVVLLTQGVERWRVLGAVMGLVVFAIPMPMFVTGKLVFVLKEIAVDSGISLANLLGTGATRSGANVAIPNQEIPLVVADACGGLRSLVSLMTVGYVVAFFMGRARGFVPWAVLLIAVPVALASNVVRIAAMCWMSGRWGVEVGAGIGHDIVNGVVWLGAIAALLGFDGGLSRRFER